VSLAIFTPKKRAWGGAAGCALTSGARAAKDAMEHGAKEAMDRLHHSLGAGPAPPASPSLSDMYGSAERERQEKVAFAAADVSTKLGAEGVNSDRYPALSAWEVTAWTVLFNKCAGDDGAMDITELPRFLRAVGHPVSALDPDMCRQLQECLDEFDRDGNGKLEKREMFALLNRKKELEQDGTYRMRKVLPVEKPMRGVTCGCLKRSHPLRIAAQRLFYSRVRRLGTILIILVSGTLVGQTFKTETTDMERALGTAGFNGVMWTVDSLFIFVLVLDAVCVITTFGLAIDERSWLRTGWACRRPSWHRPARGQAR